jgi:beta-phosphoglucomutase-like phosphatase (HAD superfamily)
MEILKRNDIRIALASNSIKSTIDLVLMKLGIQEYMSLILSNEDVTFPKPHPEIYWKTMSHFGALPDNTIIFEDS